MNEEILCGYVRPVTDDDRKKLPTFSYSKLDVFKNCPFQFDKRYNQKMFSNDTSLPMELGGLCHYVLEQKGIILKNNLPVNYERLNETLLNGTEQIDAKTRDKMLGVTSLKRKYFDQWYEPDNASGMTYDEKLKVFDKVLHEEMEDTDWVPTYFEYSFEFVWDNRAIVHGFIDRIDVKDGEYRTVDYKTSKKVYDNSKLATSLQFGIYALAILNEFGKLPIESMYRFILIDDEQYALTKGWEKRLIKALTKLFDQVDELTKSGKWQPKPSPLCYWCNFCENNPNAHQYGGVCDYYSLWTPTNKTFETKTSWTPDGSKKRRELIF